MCEAKGHPNYYRCDCPSSKPAYHAAKARARYAASKARVSVVVDSTRTLEVGAAAPDTAAPANPSTDDRWNVADLRRLAATIDAHYANNDMDAQAELRKTWGSPLGAIRELGEAVACRAEALAGFTGEESRARFQDEYASVRIIRSRPAHSGNYMESQAVLNRATAQAKDDRTKIAAGYLAALAELRPMGGFLNIQELSPANAVEIAGRAAQIYPTAWLSKSAEAGALTVKVSKRRAFHTNNGISADIVSAPPTNYFGEWAPKGWLNRTYTLAEEGVGIAGPNPAYNRYEMQNWETSTAKKKPAGPDWEPLIEGGVVYRGHREVIVAPGIGWRRKARATIKGYSLTINPESNGINGKPDGYAIAAHEIGHHMQETIPTISAMESEWISDRTRTSEGVSQRPRPRWSGSRELVRADDFVDAYIGRVYKDNYGQESRITEVLTVGVQAMFGGGYGGLIGNDGIKSKHDDDMRAFILGMMASVRTARD